MSRGAPVLLMAAVLLGACTSSDPAGTATPGAGALDFYADPPLAVSQFLLAEGEDGAPRELHVFVPQGSGAFPLLQFQHGFTSDVDNFTELLARVAGFGFVVVAPQMYVGDPSSAPTIPDETAGAVEVLAWVQGHINGEIASHLPDLAVTASIADTGLFGHSRGGQVAWRMLFNHPADTHAHAIAGVDPVDGDAPPFPPGGTGEMVTDDPGAFDFPFASLIIGTGMGGSGAPGFECAPTNRNYTFFYDHSQPPRYEAVATAYGHNDMSNGETPDAVCIGATDSTRHLFKAFVAGQLAAYFTSVLKGDDALAWLRDLSNAPVAATGRYED